MDTNTSPVLAETAAADAAAICHACVLILTDPDDTSEDDTLAALVQKVSCVNPNCRRVVTLPLTPTLRYVAQRLVDDLHTSAGNASARLLSVPIDALEQTLVNFFNKFFRSFVRFADVMHLWHWRMSVSIAKGYYPIALLGMYLFDVMNALAVRMPQLFQLVATDVLEKKSVPEHRNFLSLLFRASSCAAPFNDPDDVQRLAKGVIKCIPPAPKVWMHTITAPLTTALRDACRIKYLTTDATPEALYAACQDAVAFVDEFVRSWATAVEPWSASARARNVWYDQEPLVSIADAACSAVFEELIAPTFGPLACMPGSLTSCLRLRDLDKAKSLFSFVTSRPVYRSVAIDNTLAVLDDMLLTSPSDDDVLRLEAWADVWDLARALLSEHPQAKRTFEMTLTNRLHDNGSNSATCVASWLSSLLRDEKRMRDDAAARRILDRSTAFVGLLRDRDVFELVYSEAFLKRVLSGQSVDDALETYALDKMRAYLPAVYVDKLADAQRDVRVSAERMSEFQRAHGELPLDAVTTLAPSLVRALPSSIAIRRRLSPDLQKALAAYESFYSSAHTGRVLNWCFQYGHAVLTCLHTAKRFDLVVTSMQMMVLMEFNHVRRHTYAELRQALASALNAELLSLCNPKIPVLKRLSGSKSASIEDEEVFELNEELTTKLARVKVPMVTVKSTATSVTTDADVAAMRAHVLDTAIVRIMKSSSTLTHKSLVEKVLEATAGRFIPDVVDIKRRVENLIEREYMVREATDTYKYLA